MLKMRRKFSFSISWVTGEGEVLLVYVQAIFWSMDWSRFQDIADESDIKPEALHKMQHDIVLVVQDIQDRHRQREPAVHHCGYFSASGCGC